jgi:glucosamine-6-phosphate deaminase
VDITVAADADEVADRAAAWVKEHAVRGTFVTFAVGASVEGAYRALRAERDCLRGVHGVSVDELHPLPMGDPRTFGRQLADMLGPETTTGLTLERFDPSAPDPDEEARRVDRVMLDRGVSACVLGLGPNGHLAFNEPGEPLDAPSRAVGLRPSTVAHLGGRAAIAPARGAMTLGLPTLLAADHVLLVVLGDKRAAFAKLLLGPLTPRVPASILRLHPRVTVLCTPEEAADVPANLLGIATRRR